jgi:hypothetical protein
VSKRHNSSRRRTYGRRLHEVHERQDRRPQSDRMDVQRHASAANAQAEPLSFVGPGATRPRYGFID